LLKEMERALLFCEWKDKKWQGSLEKCRHLSKRSYVLEGAIAYATEQAFVERWRRIKWEESWVKLRAKGQEVLDKKLRGEEVDLEDISLEIEAGLDDEEDVGSVYSISDDGL
jgi:hypothetical protein